MKRPSFYVLMLWLAAAVLLLTGGPIGGCGLIGPPPPYASEGFTALIVENTSARTMQIDSVMDAVEASTKAGGGAVRRLSDKQSDFSMDAPWVAPAFGAFRAAKGQPPWIVAATPRTGINQALPADTAAAVALVKPLGGK